MLGFGKAIVGLFLDMETTHMKVRVRFAPSPTGFLHIGGARTALFNWLYARHTGGTFVLRIEDTDVARNTQEATDVILDGLRWLGLDWDEGPVTSNPSTASKGDYGPYFQSQRKDIYAKRVQELIDKGLAYKSDGAIKFKMQREPMLIPDLVVGDVRRELTDREQVDPDFVIIRSDGEPVFHLVNVIDDLDMKITHVIRGEDHLSNTAKHIALFKAFGAEPPKYAHIPLILNGDGTKMSKRDTGASLRSYVEGGYAPEAVVNYLCLLGWSPKGNREKLPIDEIVKLFDLPQILRHNARFDLDKLHWLDGEYLRELSPERFRELGVQALVRAGYRMETFSPEYVTAALATCLGKLKSFGDLAAYGGFYFTDTVKIDPAIVAQDFTPECKTRLATLRGVYAGLKEFNAAALETALRATAEETLKIKRGLLIHPLRLACTGSTTGPSLYHLLEVLGKESVLKRLDSVLNS